MTNFSSFLKQPLIDDDSDEDDDSDDDFDENSYVEFKWDKSTVDGKVVWTIKWDKSTVGDTVVWTNEQIEEYHKKMISQYKKEISKEAVYSTIRQKVNNLKFLEKQV